MDWDYNYKTVPKFVFFGTYKCQVKELVICNIGIRLTAIPFGDKRSNYTTHFTISWIEVAEMKICPDQANPVVAIQPTHFSVAMIQLKMNLGKSDHFCFDPTSNLLGEKWLIFALQGWEPQVEVWLEQWVRFSKVSVEKANCMIQLADKPLISGSKHQTEEATTSITTPAAKNPSGFSTLSIRIYNLTDNYKAVPKFVFFGTYKCQAKEFFISHSEFKLISVPPNDNLVDYKFHVTIPWIEVAEVKICPEPDNPMISIRPTFASVVKTQEAMNIGKSSSDFQFNPYSNSAGEKWLIVALERWDQKIKDLLGKAKMRYLKITVESANSMIKLAEDAFIGNFKTTTSSTTAATDNIGDNISSSATVCDTPTNSCIALQQENRRPKRGNEQLDQESGRLKEENTELKRENEESKREKKRLKKEKKQLDKEVERLKGENDSLKQEKDNLKREKDGSKRKNEQLNQENERLKQENARLKLKQQMIQQLIN